MKRIALGIIVAVLFTANAEVFGEVTNGSLTTTWSYDRTYEMITIRAYNSHPSKSLKVTKIKIWNNACSNISSSSAGDRTYAINQIVRPLSDRKITVNAYLPRGKGGNHCSVIHHDMIEPRKWKPPPKKSGSQKLLDKIIGR